MEKIKFSVVTAFAAVLILFTSCLGDKSNEASGSAYGLIKYDTSKNKYLLYGLDTYPIYSETVNNYGSLMSPYEERIVGVHYQIDFDAEINANYASRGYLEGTIQIEQNININYNRSIYPRYEEIGEETAIENEVKIIGLEVPKGGYISTYLLLGISVDDYHKNDNLDLYLEYYQDQEPGTHEGANRYDVYLKAIHGKAETTESRNTYSELAQFNLANPISSFKRHESSTSTGFWIRIRYVLDIDKEGEIKFGKDFLIPVYLN